MIFFKSILSLYLIKEGDCLKLAVNYSKEAENLVKNESVHVDLFKCPGFSHDLVQHAQSIKPCYVHFGLNAGSQTVHEADWNQIKELKEKTSTPYVNVHAVAFTKDYPNFDIFTTNPKEVTEIIEATIRDIELVAEKFGRENIIVENVICRGKGENMIKAIIEPDVLSKIIDETGVNFLFDTAHAQMTSKSLGLDVYEYISKLPLEHLKELHITGIQPDQNGRLRDSMPMSDDNWKLASWVIKRIKDGDWPKPWAVAFEYGGIGPHFGWRSDEDVLAKQLPILHELIYK